MPALPGVRRLVAFLAGAVLIGYMIVALGTAAGKPLGGRPSAPAEAGKATRHRYMINSGPSAPRVASYGWNLLDVSSKWRTDRPPGRTRGMVWHGDYDK